MLTVLREAVRLVGHCGNFYNMITIVTHDCIYIGESSGYRYPIQTRVYMTFQTFDVLNLYDFHVHVSVCI